MCLWTVYRSNIATIYWKETKISKECHVANMNHFHFFKTVYCTIQKQSNNELSCNMNKILALPLNKWFDNGFKPLWSPCHFKSLLQKCEKRDIFLITHFGRQANGDGTMISQIELSKLAETLSAILWCHKIFGGCRCNTEISILAVILACLALIVFWRSDLISKMLIS